MKMSKHTRSILSTLMGALVATLNAWVNVDWNTFAFDAKHIAPLFISGMIALGGYMTTINAKDNGTNK